MNVASDLLRRFFVTTIIFLILAPGATGTCDDPLVTLISPSIEVIEEGSADLHSEVELLFDDPHFAEIRAHELYITFYVVDEGWNTLLTIETG